METKPVWLKRVGEILDHPLGNGAWFYLLWLSAVVGRDAWLPLTASLILVHLVTAESAKAELAAGLPLAALGALLDSALSQMGFFTFESYQWAPPWLVAVWLGFAFCLHRSMQYFSHHWLACMGFGGLGGAFSYWSGMKLGAVYFGFSEPVSFAVLALIWAAIFPLFVFVNQNVRSRLSGRVAL